MKNIALTLCIFCTSLLVHATNNEQLPVLAKSNLYYATVRHSTAPENSETVTIEKINQARSSAFLEFFKSKNLTDTTKPYIQDIVEAGAYCVSDDAKPQDTLYGCLKAIQQFNKAVKDFEPSPYKELYLELETHPHTPSYEEIVEAQKIYSNFLQNPPKVGEHQRSMFYVYSQSVGKVLDDTHNASPTKSRGVVEIYIYYLAEGIKVRNKS